MNFSTWIRALAARDLRVLTPSHAAPVELWAERPDGDIVHFRCRGTTVRLRHYARDDVLTVTPSNDCACGCGQHLPAVRTASRVLTQPDAAPLREASWDGRHHHGWRHHEAGLLDVAEASDLFNRLYAQLERNAHDVKLGSPQGTIPAPADAASVRASFTGGLATSYTASRRHTGSRPRISANASSELS